MPSYELPEGVERWMVDAEHGDCEPIEAMLLSKGPTAEPPENGTLLIRVSDLDAIRSQERQRARETLGKAQKLVGENRQAAAEQVLHRELAALDSLEER